MTVPVKMAEAGTGSPVSVFRMPLRTSRFPAAPSPCAGDLYVVFVALSSQGRIAAPSGWTTWVNGSKGLGRTWAVFWRLLDGHETGVCFTGDPDGQWYAEGYLASPLEQDQETTKAAPLSHT